MEVVHDFILAFQRWCAFDGKAASGPKYVGYLACFNREYAEPTHSTWDGLYAYAYGHKAPKEVVEVGSFREFESLYGMFRLSVLSAGCPDGMDVTNYAKILDWYNKPEVKGPSCLNAALNAYRDFMIWKALQTPILKEFSAWLALPERNKGKGLAEKTQSRYVKAIVFLDCAMRAWGVDPDCDLWEARTLKQITDIDSQIRSSLQFEYYNNNKTSDGAAKNLNGTGFLDPSAALSQFCEFSNTKLFDDNTETAPKISPGCPIDIALAEFKEHRLDDDWVKLLKRDGYEGLHARYEAMNPDALRDMDDAAFDKWIEEELWAASTFFCRENIKKLSHEQKQECAKFIASTKMNFKLTHKYFGANPEVPVGFGPVVATELLMKFHPLDYIGYSKLMLQGLKTLGLVENENPPNTVTLADYYQVMGRASMLLDRLTEAKVPRMFNESAVVPPDYVTVNEFLWWCKHYRKEILKKYWEKYMKTEIKPAEQKKIEDFSDFIKQLERDVADVGLTYASGLMKRFVCAQLAKPFVVLTGLSGSGKTKLAQAFTDWIAVEHTAKVVPVGADWTNSEKLLGYPNALDETKYVLPDTGVLKLMLDAKDNPEMPFFLILDEMNLSHVERYFADFLSVMESEGTIKLYDGAERFADDGTPVPPTLPWPKNLFVIGTMNVDETTYMFSPKVLDRAQAIEFRVEKKDIDAFLATPKAPNMKDLAGKGACYAKAFLALAADRKNKKPDATDLATVKTALTGMFEELAKLGSEFGFRSAIEMVNFIAFYLEASGYAKLAVGTPRKDCLTAAIDAAVLQKLLPKLHGALNRLGPVLDALIARSSTTIPDATDPDAEPLVKKTYPLTYEKLTRMKTRLESNGFTSFAEA